MNQAQSAQQVTNRRCPDDGQPCWSLACLSGACEVERVRDWPTKKGIDSLIDKANGMKMAATGWRCPCCGAGCAPTASVCENCRPGVLRNSQV